MRPTKEEQDRYFREKGLDPWGYEDPSVQARLDQSLRFIQRFVPPNFDGTFVEVGAFNGMFTRKLADAFPRAAVFASDLVQAAWETANANRPFPASVTFQWTDMMDLELPASCSGRPSVLLMLECLYYISPESRSEAVDKLAHSTSAKMAFVSGPLGSGDQYLHESSLDSMFRRFWPQKLGSMRVMPIGCMNILRHGYRRLIGKPVIKKQVIFGFKKLS